MGSLFVNLRRNYGVRQDEEFFIDNTGFHKSHNYHSANRAAVIKAFVVFIQHM
jgi:hypothetical protein